MSTAYIGIDLHRTVIQICVLDGKGGIRAEERVRYQSLEEGLRAVAFVQNFAPDCRVAVEALGLHRWFVHACREAGLDILVCDARKLDRRKLGKKTDRRDAREIARRLWRGDLDRIARTDYPSDVEYGRRKLQRVRHRMVQMRQQTINQLRGMLNAYPIAAPRAALYTRPSRARLADVQFPVPELQQAFTALLAVLDELQQQINGLNRRVRRLLHEESNVAVLVAELPGIGAQSAATLLAELGEAKRFVRPRAVAAYAGLVPSGEPVRRPSASRPNHETGELGAALDPFAVGGPTDPGQSRRQDLGPDAATPGSQEQSAHGPRETSARGVWITLTRGESFDLQRCLGMA